MDDRITLGILAMLAGAAVGVVLFVPFVAVSYRRRGGLGFWRFAGWAAFLVYFFAIWTYTLLPLPDPDAIRCVGAITDPMSVVRDLQAAFAGPGNPLRSPELLQLVFNVLLFLPLGFFVRVLFGRGFVVAVLIGFAVSLLVETTQLTGVWGIYPCAYRFFDVGDLMTNTTGALIGAVLSLVVPKRHRGFSRTADADEPDPVTRGRRVLAAFCDLLGAWLFAAAVATTVALSLRFVFQVPDADIPEGLFDLVSGLAVIALWLTLILATGRSVGDLAVELRYRGGTLPVPLARLLRFAGGVGGYYALDLLPAPWSTVSGLFLFVALVLVFTTRRGRGLPGLLSDQELTDAREGDGGSVPPSVSGRSSSSTGSR
ncbi:VanZ family protein [Microbacterium sp.]|uniref:VanZ family protein n=1 Tax=Microbacterium sp. TaxID=51671 RepID=UPI0039E50B53